jgi:hypothetical protein
MTDDLRHYECVVCLRQRSEFWDVPVGPCQCRTSHPYPWRVLAQPRPRAPGHVIVMGHKGWQDIAQTFREDPNGWKPYPVRKP